MDIPPLIEIGSNPVWLFVLFALLLLVFHVWLVCWRPIGEIGWKRVDYIWLGIAAVGLVGQAAQVRQHWYSSAYEISHYKVAGTLSALIRQANFAVGPSVCRSFNLAPSSPRNLVQIQAEYDFACAEFKQLTREVRNADGSRDVGFLDLLDTTKTRSRLTDGILIDILATLDRDHKAFIDALKERSDAKYKTRTTANEFVLVVFSPFLLMMAVALRTAKVTGEIRLKR